MSPDALLAAVVEGSDDAIISKTLGSVVMSWNSGAEQLFGWTAQEMIGQSIRKLIPEDRQAEEDAILERIVAGGRVAAMQSVRLRKDGEPVRVSMTVSPVRDREGRIIGASQIARDVDALEVARAELAQSERRFQMMADNISQLAWMADPKGDIFWYNRRWVEYTGLTIEECSGWGWKQVHHPDHVDRVTSRIQHSWDTGEIWEDTFPLRRHDGQWRWFLSRARPIRDAAGHIVNWFGTNTDVTEQRQQAEAIQTLLNEVNHRSKNMLTLIQSLARRSAPGNDQFLKRFTRRIDALAANQDLLVRRAWTNACLHELIKAQLAFALDIAGKQIAFDGPMIDISARAAETLGMAMHEMATNALKYGALSEESGRVRIDWQVDGDRFTLTWRESGGPTVKQPERNGFGTSVIRDIPTVALDAESVLNYDPEGLVWRFSCPLDRVRAG